MQYWWLISNNMKKLIRTEIHFVKIIHGIKFTKYYDTTKMIMAIGDLI